MKFLFYANRNIHFSYISALQNHYPCGKFIVCNFLKRSNSKLLAVVADFYFCLKLVTALILNYDEVIVPHINTKYLVFTPIFIPFVRVLISILLHKSRLSLFNDGFILSLEHTHSDNDLLPDFDQLNTIHCWDYSRIFATQAIIHRLTASGVIINSLPFFTATSSSIYESANYHFVNDILTDLRTFIANQCYVDICIASRFFSGPQFTSDESSQRVCIHILHPNKNKNLLLTPYLTDNVFTLELSDTPLESFLIQLLPLLTNCQLFIGYSSVIFFLLYLKQSLYPNLDIDIWLNTDTLNTDRDRIAFQDYTTYLGFIDQPFSLTNFT